MEFMSWFVLLRILTMVVLLYPKTAAPTLACTWQETFHDDFNGSSLDTKKWNTKYPPGNFGELQYYAPDAFAVKDGILHITAEKRSLAGRHYTSGIITSVNSFSQQYGYFKMRAKVPAGKGFWPGFWLLPKKAHYPWEIDVFELKGDDPSTIYMTNHWRDQQEEHQKQTKKYTGPDFSKGFHNFAIKWSPSEIVWLIDGVERYRTERGVPAEPMFMLINLAIGGDWPGSPNASTPFPSAYEIDFIEAYQQSCKIYLPYSSNNFNGSMESVALESRTFN